MKDYRAPWWLPGGHAQTIVPTLLGRWFHPLPKYRRETWQTPGNDDFLVLDWLASGGEQTLFVLFHGLEGASDSHYAKAFATQARERGFAFVMPHFRSCGGVLNRSQRTYHSGDYQEIDWILKRLRAQHRGRLLVAGVSLGGNALLRWAGEAGESARAVVDGVAAVSAPVDLAAAGESLRHGFNFSVYTREFLRTMKPKALAKLAQHPGLFDRVRLETARDLYEFDDTFTAPLHGFAGVDDYYARASAKPHLDRVRVPTLVLNARNDPFLPADRLPQQHEVSEHVTLWQPEHGGHVGFPSNGSMPKAVLDWLVSAAPRPA
ncbi:MAG: alpha/beta fold hydrolase [Burkholderiales bacterium]|nr:alpha/beta fold hydrolase [Burkholderiales bacterium]